MIRVAMWSGPRNISTAMMRSFGSRADTVVVDEPFYAAYLAATGLDHPLRDAVIASQPTDPETAIAGLLAPPGAPIQYQKHITVHMLPDFELDWLAACRSAFLIRAPERVLASYARKRAEVTLADIGFVRQAEIFAREADRRGAAPPVIDAEDVLADPAGTLAALCAALGIAFDDRMLAWAPGRHDSDGAWAAHWYGAVERSTGFALAGAADSEPETLRADLRRIAEEARPYYERLRAARLTTTGAAGSTGVASTP